MIKTISKMDGSLGAYFIPDHLSEMPAEQGSYIGDFVKLEDGFYYWWPDETKKGCLSEGNLLEIAKELNRLNRDWNEFIANDPAVSETAAIKIDATTSDHDDYIIFLTCPTCKKKVEFHEVDWKKEYGVNNPTLQDLINHMKEWCECN